MDRWADRLRTDRMIEQKKFYAQKNTCELQTRDDEHVLILKLFGQSCFMLNLPRIGSINLYISVNVAVVVVKWSTGSPSTLTIRVQTMLKWRIFFCKIVRKEPNKRKRGRDGSF